METTMMSNGKLRRSLSAEIDRLDHILDGLSEALQATIAEAVAAAVQQAVREVLTSPQVTQHFARAAETKRTAPRVDWRRRWLVARVLMAACITAARTALTRRWTGVRQWGMRTLQGVKTLRRHSMPMLLSVVIGIASGLAAVVGNPCFVGIVAGVSTLIGMLATRSQLLVQTACRFATSQNT